VRLSDPDRLRISAASTTWPTLGDATPRPGDGTPRLSDLEAQPVRRSVALRLTVDVHGPHASSPRADRSHDTFATRDLLDEVRRNVAFVAATVSDRTVRIFEGAGDLLSPVVGRGVPLERLPDETDVSWERRTVSLLRRVGAGTHPLVLFGAGRRVATLVRAVDRSGAGA
jgi:hypothetical protein